MNLPFFIAWRYLFAKKSHNVINIISAISAIGMAIGTAALIVILSVFNGFDSLVRSSMGNVEPDILITPSRGKVFVPNQPALDWAYKSDKVKTICSILQENVYISYNGSGGLAKARGVDAVYEEESTIARYITEGKFQLHLGDVPRAVVGRGLARSMGIRPQFVAPIEMYFPDREAQLSMANPAAALNGVKCRPSGLFAVNGNVDDELIIVPIELMRELLGYTEEVSGIELRLQEGTSKGECRRIIKSLSAQLGEDFRVEDRFRQNESLYKMMRYEKVSVYLILIFVVIIIAFNIFGSLSMLIIEKRGDIGTLRAMGANEVLVRRIFVLEGWMISLLGMLAGVAAGLLLAYLQQKFGFVRMPGGFAASAYPVIIKWSDVALTALSVALIGYIIALIPSFTLKGEK